MAGNVTVQFEEATTASRDKEAIRYCLQENASIIYRAMQAATDPDFVVLIDTARGVTTMPRSQVIAEADAPKEMLSPADVGSCWVVFHGPKGVTVGQMMIFPTDNLGQA